MKTLLTLLALTFTLQTHAQLAVYKLKVTGTSTGADAARQLTRSGYMVLEARTGRLTQIPVDTAGKRFSVTEWQGHSIEYVTGTPGHKYVIFASAETVDGKPDSSFLKGLSKSTALGLNGKWDIALSMTGTGRTLRYLGTVPVYDEATLTLTLDTKATSDANFFTKGFDDTTNALRAKLRDQGYLQQ